MSDLEFIGKLDASVRAVYASSPNAPLSDVERMAVKVWCATVHRRIAEIARRGQGGDDWHGRGSDVCGPGEMFETLWAKVRDDHLEAVEQFNADRLKAVKRRRCGIPFEASGAREEKENVATEADGKKKREARYPEVRGLRFCPERRLYLDRDRESAVAIARLRTLELLGKPRPAPFVKGFKAPTTEQSNQLAKKEKRVTTHAKAGEKGRRTRTHAPTVE